MSASETTWSKAEACSDDATPKLTGERREVHQDDPLGQAFADTFEHLSGFVHGAIGEDDDELLAAVASRDVDRPK